ncbi:WxL domain-containing protein [Enterococcus sp. AZ109]|uniref:WxL domain-containing protein n=1 Tax=Enterococcus sp. AZ109 TaxID=2774634 RepID=UPI003F282208
MKKSTVLLATLLVSASVLGGTVASAADYGSTGEITFKQGEGGTKPVDPVNPDPEKPVDPVDPTDPTGPKPGTDGPLSIDYASSFQFREQKISSKKETYNADLQTYKNSEVRGPNYVQVTDTTGEYTGWKLTVTQNAQFAKGTSVLTGAELSLKNIVANSANPTNAPVVGGDIALVPGEASTIATAQDKHGKGTWAMRFGTDTAQATESESVQLEVPGTANPEKGTYTTELTWTLTEGPN